MINKESFQIQKLSEFSEFKIKYNINIGRENTKKYKRKIVTYFIIRSSFCFSLYLFNFQEITNQKSSIYGMALLKRTPNEFMKKALISSMNLKVCGGEDFILQEILNIQLSIIPIKKIKIRNKYF